VTEDLDLFLGVALTDVSNGEVMDCVALGEKCIILFIGIHNVEPVVFGLFEN
jgi:hypothetical protein